MKIIIQIQKSKKSYFGRNGGEYGVNIQQQIITNVYIINHHQCVPFSYIFVLYSTQKDPIGVSNQNSPIISGLYFLPQAPIMAVSKLSGVKTVAIAANTLMLNSECRTRQFKTIPWNPPKNRKFANSQIRNASTRSQLVKRCCARPWTCPALTLPPRRVLKAFMATLASCCASFVKPPVPPHLLPPGRTVGVICPRYSCTTDVLAHSTPRVTPTPPFYSSSRRKQFVYSEFGKIWTNISKLRYYPTHYEDIVDYNICTINVNISAFLSGTQKPKNLKL